MDKKITFKFSAEEINAKADKIYKRDAIRYKVQGFRDGKAPRRIIEQNYGDVFFEPAVNEIFNSAYQNYLIENPIMRPVAEPEVEVKPDNNGGLEFNVTISVQDEFKLPKYTGLEIKSHEMKIDDNEIDKFLERMKNERVRMVTADKNKKIAKGDIAVIDFAGSIDGVEFAGGTAKNHELEIGSHSFIDNFEDQLVGKSVGDEIDVNVSFPKEYHAKELAGKPALFKVKINNILLKEFPEINDEFAKQSSQFETLAEFRTDIKTRLEKQAETEIDHQNEEKLLQTITDATDIKVHPKIAEQQYQQVIGNLTERLAQNGLNLETYAMYNGMTLEQFETRQREFAKIGAKTGLVLDAIGKQENIKNFDDIIKFLKQKNKFI